MTQAASRPEADTGKRAEAYKAPEHGDHKDQGATSEVHAQMDAFRSTLKKQALLDHDFSSPSAVSKGKLEDLYKSVNKSMGCLTDLELVDAKATAHKITEEKQAHHGHSDTLDALRKAQEAAPKTEHSVGMYNAIVIGAAAESGGHVTENKYFPFKGGPAKSNDNPNAVTYSPADTEKFVTLHPPKKGQPTPID